jgi:prepilin-type N-terminal cleavage/methylation domain-containing protein
MKKKKRGFTLIELLAIIVILAIIAVITVPIILNIIDTSKKGAIRDSVYGYKDAINKSYLSELSKEFKNDTKLDGAYAINGLDGSLIGDKYYPINLSGNIPTNGYIVIENNEMSGCLQFDEYKVNITNGNVGDAQKGSCDKIIINRQNDGEITVGDTVIIGTETFDVIKSTNEETTLLAKYNLYVGNTYTIGSDEVTSISENQKGYGLQNPLAKGYTPQETEIIGTLAFSENPYWYGEEGGVNVSLKQKYGASANESNIYDDDYNEATGNNYSIAYYIEKYIDSLIELGAPNNTTGRILTYAEYYELLQSKPSIVYNDTSYWLGSVYSNDNVDSIFSSPASFGYTRYDNSETNGLRSVIIVPTTIFSE